MDAVTENGITVDRCRGCGGIWFDLFEAEDIIETVDVSTVDTGSKAKGIIMDHIRDIKCPKCNIAMQTASDREDPTLKFEVCTGCHGYFLDAGELKDMSNVTAVESGLETLIHKAKMFGEAFKSMHYKQD
ncbi:MAG: zf-TFIIB domain-containing protein [Kiritimatiellales bacterium]|nr:zf-TFIIB domain-containing protein [Kiritimatiellales bacterium]